MCVRCGFSVSKYCFTKSTVRHAKIWINVFLHLHVLLHSLFYRGATTLRRRHVYYSLIISLLCWMQGVARHALVLLCSIWVIWERQEPWIRAWCKSLSCSRCLDSGLPMPFPLPAMVRLVRSWTKGVGSHVYKAALYTWMDRLQKATDYRRLRWLALSAVSSSCSLKCSGSPLSLKGLRKPI